MTDGIIQQVIKKWLKKPYGSIEELQQELIEKIKQEFPDIKGYSQYSWTIRQILIGDNQE